MMHESKHWNLKSIIFVCAVCVMVGRTAHAQQRPLVTEDPETIGSGRILLEGGFSLDRDQENSAHGITGDIARLATFGVSAGISPFAEIQIDGGLLQRLNVTGRVTDHPPTAGSSPFEAGDKTASMEDLVVATKIRLVSEGASRPAFGVRFGTKLPLPRHKKASVLGRPIFLRRSSSQRPCSPCAPLETSA